MDTRRRFCSCPHFLPVFGRRRRGPAGTIFSPQKLPAACGGGCPCRDTIFPSPIVCGLRRQTCGGGARPPGLFSPRSNGPCPAAAGATFAGAAARPGGFALRSARVPLPRAPRRGHRALYSPPRTSLRPRPAVYFLQHTPCGSPCSAHFPSYPCARSTVCHTPPRPRTFSARFFTAHLPRRGFAAPCLGKRRRLCYNKTRPTLAAAAEKGTLPLGLWPGSGRCRGAFCGAVCGQPRG